jgi:hypothetical protein
MELTGAAIEPTFSLPRKTASASISTAMSRSRVAMLPALTYDRTMVERKSASGAISSTS